MISIPQMDRLADLSVASVKAECTIHNIKEIGSGLINYKGEKNDKLENAALFLDQNIEILSQAASSLKEIFKRED